MLNHRRKTAFGHAFSATSDNRKTLLYFAGWETFTRFITVLSAKGNSTWNISRALISGIRDEGKGRVDGTIRSKTLFSLGGERCASTHALCIPTIHTGRLETFPDASNASHSAGGTCIYRGTQIGCNRRPHREMPRRGVEYASRRREIVASVAASSRIIIIVNRRIVAPGQRNRRSANLVVYDPFATTLYDY